MNRKYSLQPKPNRGMWKSNSIGIEVKKIPYTTSGVWDHGAQSTSRPPLKDDSYILWSSHEHNTMYWLTQVYSYYSAWMT